MIFPLARMIMENQLLLHEKSPVFFSQLKKIFKKIFIKVL